MAEPRDDQGDESQVNPYEVSPASVDHLNKQPTAVQIIWASMLAIFAGVIVFFTTCFGTGILADTYLDSEPFALLILAFVVGVLAAALAIHKTYRLVIRSRVSKVSGERTGDNNG